MQSKKSLNALSASQMSGKAGCRSSRRTLSLTDRTGMLRMVVIERAYRLQWRAGFIGVLTLLLFMVLSVPIQAQVNVLTERYDNGRTGANLNETILNTSNVTAGQFGKLYSIPVDGSVYGQPLYVTGVNVPSTGVHNVLYVVTMNDVVYAFDADSAGVLLWSVDYKNPAAGVTAIPIPDIVGTNTLNIVGNVGIESTPVIDLASKSMYLVARTKEVSGGATNYVARLHALDITTGAEKFGGPTMIQGSVPGVGTGSTGGTLTFDPFIQNQRSSLALANGSVVFSWASHEDQHAWHGWVMAYDKQTLQQTSILSFTPNGTGGGSWMAGRGPAVDSGGNVYYMTGNGDWDGGNELSDSIIKLSTTGGVLSVADYFTPDDYAGLQARDEDLGSSGPMLVPGTDLVIGGGKESVLYLTHVSPMGHEQTGNGQLVQLLPSGTSGHFTGGGPSFWNRTSGAGPTMYIWADASLGQAFHFNGSSFDTTPISRSTVSGVSGFATGAVVTISAAGSTPASGIVWASMPTQSAGHGTSPGILRAFDANDLTRKLWDTGLSQDDPGTWSKFVPPTVANGKVYLASFSNAVNVYGLLPQAPDFTVGASPGTQTVSPDGSASYTVSVGAVNGFGGTVNLSVSGLPAGANGTFSAGSVSGTGSSTLTVTTVGVTAGSSTLTITGTSGAVAHTATVNLTITTTVGSPGVIGIDFVGQDVPMGAGEVVGVVAQGNWNNAVGASSSAPMGLVDGTGAATGATVAWSSNNVWQTPIADHAGNARMMKGYLDTGNATTTTVSVAGLAGNATGYSVYVYVDGDNRGANRTGKYQISGAGIPTTLISNTDAGGANFGGTYKLGNNGTGNYVVFTINATSFTLSATPGASNDTFTRAPINGIQIVKN